MWLATMAGTLVAIWTIYWPTETNENKHYCLYIYIFEYIQLNKPHNWDKQCCSFKTHSQLMQFVAHLMHIILRISILHSIYKQQMGTHFFTYRYSFFFTIIWCVQVFGDCGFPLYELDWLMTPPTIYSA